MCVWGRMKVYTSELTKKNKCVFERAHICLCAYLCAFSKSALLDSRGKNGHGLGATFHLPGRERRTPSDGVPKHQGSFV